MSLNVWRKFVYTVFVRSDPGATSTEVALTTLGGELLNHRGDPGDIEDGPRSVLDGVKECSRTSLRSRGLMRGTSWP